MYLHALQRHSESHHKINMYLSLNSIIKKYNFFYDIVVPFHETLYYQRLCFEIVILKTC